MKLIRNWLKKIEYVIFLNLYRINERMYGMKLRTRLVIMFIAVSIIPLLIVSLITFYSFKSSIENEFIDSSKKILSLISRSVNNIFENIENTSLQIVATPDISDYYKQPANNELKNFIARRELDERYITPFITASKYLSSIVIVSEINGDIAAFGERGEVDFLNFKNEPVYSSLIKTRKSMWLYSPEKTGPKSSGLIILLQPVIEFNTGKVLGILALQVKDEKIFNIFDTLNMKNRTEILIIDSCGNILSDEGKYTHSVVLPGNDKEYILANSKGTYKMQINNKDILLNFVSLSNGWKLVHIIPYSRIGSGVTRVLVITVFICIITIMIIIFITWVVSNSVTRPVMRLTECMNRVKGGDFDISLKVETKDEIGQLCEDFNIMIFRIKELVNNIIVIQKKKNEAEFKNLQGQITPHFLFNTLNSIKCLAVTKCVDDDIANMTDLLIRLLQKSVKYKNEYITVEEEVALAEYYLRLQKYRYKERFAYFIKIDENVRNFKTLKLVLQPIVENSLLHGFENKERQSVISITVKLHSNNVLMRVEDNGKGIAMEDVDRIRNGLYRNDEKHVNHIGLNNINERIKLFFGQEYGLRIESEVGKGTIVDIIVPIVDTEV